MTKIRWREVGDDFGVIDATHDVLIDENVVHEDRIEIEPQKTSATINLSNGKVTIIGFVDCSNVKPSDEYIRNHRSTSIDSLLTENPVDAKGKVDASSPGSIYGNNWKWSASTRLRNFDPTGDNFGRGHSYQDPEEKCYTRVASSTFVVDDCRSIRWFCPVHDIDFSVNKMVMYYNDLNGQTSFLCPKCSATDLRVTEHDKEVLRLIYHGKYEISFHHKPFTSWHEIPASFRNQLIREGYLPKTCESTRIEAINNAIIQYVTDHPDNSFTEIDRALDLPPRTAFYHCHCLQDDGILKIRVSGGKPAKVSIKKRRRQAKP